MDRTTTFSAFSFGINRQATKKTALNTKTGIDLATTEFEAGAAVSIEHSNNNL